MWVSRGPIVFGLAPQMSFGKPSVALQGPVHHHWDLSDLIAATAHFLPHWTHAMVFH